MLPPGIVEAAPKSESVVQRQIANGLAELILAGFVRDGDTVLIDAAPDGEGVTLTTEASPEEGTVTGGM